MFNITYYPIFSKLKNILFKIHLLLTRDREYRNVFENVPIIGFKKGKSLKDILVRAKVSPLKTEKGFCGPCNKPRCEICKHIIKTHEFESLSTKRIYSIKGRIHCEIFLSRHFMKYSFRVISSNMKYFHEILLP